MKLFTILFLSMISVIPCWAQKEDKSTITFYNHNQKKPFGSCLNTHPINNKMVFSDSENTFTIIIDSLWTYNKSEDSETIFHFFHPQNDTSIKLCIGVEKELYSQDMAKKHINMMFDHDNFKLIKFASDSCYWNLQYSSSNLEGGEFKYFTLSSFYYFEKSSSRFFTIQIMQERVSSELSNTNFECLFAETLKSFQPAM